MDKVMVTEWQPIDTANVSQLFASSQWVLVATDRGRVELAIPFYFDAGGYFWLTLRGSNLRGNDNERSQYLRESPTHWMSIPSHPSAGGNEG